MDNLQTGGFFNEKVTKSCLFFSVHDAVLYFEASTKQSPYEVKYRTRTQTSTYAETVSESEDPVARFTFYGHLNEGAA